MHTQEQIEAIVADVFRRLSSNGKEPVGDAFTADGRYEGAYPAATQNRDDDNALNGRDVISRFFHQVLPQVLSPFDQWADKVYVALDGDTATVEGRSHGTAVHDGSTYENRYVWIMRFEDGKIAFMREYFNPVWYDAAVGSAYQDVIAQVFPSEEFSVKAGVSNAAE
jgi:ketosteroid isomerase-like protein